MKSEKHTWLGEDEMDAVCRALAAYDAGASDEEVCEILGITEAEMDAAKKRVLRFRRKQEGRPRLVSLLGKRSQGISKT